MQANTKTVTLSVVAMGVLGALSADALAASTAKSYVLQANGRWTDAQTLAVQAAGGTVTFRHGETGIGVVTSSNPKFQQDANASKAFSAVTPDEMVQWQKPGVTFDASDADGTVNPNPPGDAFYPFVQWAPQSVGAPDAWAQGCTGKGVRVAILDGGIYRQHIDLTGQIDEAASRSFVPGQAWDTDTGTFWHGTHVAGIVAAKANNLAEMPLGSVGQPRPDNKGGVVGIAPEATLIGVKVLHSGSGEFGWLIEGLLYAATPVSQGGAGADIINMSLGALFPKNETGAGQLVAAVNKAVNYANRYGVLTVSSAGNNGVDLDHAGNYVSVPAQSGSGISISATGPLGYALGATDFSRPASYTNYGTSVINVAAPGGDAAYPGNEFCAVPRADGSLVVNPCWVFDMVISTSRGTAAQTTGSWSWAAGTSMAAPAASAVAAIIKQSHPGISLGELKNRLAQSAIDEGKPGRDPFYGVGYVNAFRGCTAK
jgi:subtilisin family serine protease